MHSLKQQLLILAIVPLVVLSIFGSVFTATYVRDRASLAKDSKATGDLAAGEEIINLMYPGSWQVKDGLLYKGGVQISNDFTAVDRIAELTGDTVTIFLGDTRVATTIRGSNGTRAVGTKASEKVVEKVLKNGEVYLGQANVLGEYYRTAYKPIYDDKGKIIGMFYVGISKKLSDELMYKSLFTIITVAAVLTLIVAWIAWFYAQRAIIGPLQQITMTTRAVATGDLIKKVQVSGSKEIDDLALAFNQMIEGMQSFSQQINRVSGEVKGGEKAVDVTQVLLSKENVNIREYVAEEGIPKGLNEATLKQVTDFIKDKEPMSAEVIGEGVGLTRVTARRYLEYLEQVGKVEVEFKYGTIGRPVKLYKLVVGEEI